MAVLARPREARIVAQIVTGAVVPPAPPAEKPRLATTPDAARLVASAEAQVGVTRRYDPAYVALAFLGGDVASDRGVCSDVLIRALRTAHGIDLQLAVNRDMKSAFTAYPALWGLTRPDSNIDHRRVPNLETFLTRAGARVPLGRTGADFLPDDIVTSRVPGNRPHVMIVTDCLAPDGTPMVVHNIGAGTRIEAALFDHDLTAQFRLTPALIAGLARTAD